jgi:hypothetical protein
MIYDNTIMLGCIQDRPFLGFAALLDLERILTNAVLITGQQHRWHHCRREVIYLVATLLECFLQQMRTTNTSVQRTLYVCHSSRSDILLGYLMKSVHHASTTTTMNRSSYNSNTTTNPTLFESAMIVTGCIRRKIHYRNKFRKLLPHYHMNIYHHRY